MHNDWSREKPNHSEIEDKLAAKKSESFSQRRGAATGKEFVGEEKKDNNARTNHAPDLNELLSQEDHSSKKGDIWLPKTNESSNKGPLTGLFKANTRKENQPANTWVDDKAEVESKTSVKKVLQNKRTTEQNKALLESQNIRYANLIERFFAFVIDAALPYLFFYLIALLSNSDPTGRVIVASVIFVVYLTFFIDLVPSLGRKLMNITISYDKEKYDNYKKHYESRWRTRNQSPESVRSIVRVLTLPILPISIIYSFFNKNGMMLHDLPLGCETIRNPDTNITVCIKIFTILTILVLPPVDFLIFDSPF